VTRARVTVVVPTKNAARTQRACLESIVRQSVRCGLVVVDRGSVDDSEAIASGFADLVLSTAPSPTLQRNAGARALPADIIGFVDADMIAGEHVVEQAIEQIAAGAGSVVVPERSFGETYWAKVRTFERSMYQGTLEWPRFFAYDLFEALGGFDEDLIAMEDTDLGLRASTRARIGRTSDVLLHDEGADLPRGMPQEGRLRGRDRRLPPQARKPSAGIASQAPVLRAPVPAPRPADPRAGRPRLEGRRSSGRRVPSPARQGFEAEAQGRCRPQSRNDVTPPAAPRGDGTPVVIAVWPCEIHESCICATATSQVAAQVIWRLPDLQAVPIPRRSAYVCRTASFSPRILATDPVQ